MLNFKKITKPILKTHQAKGLHFFDFKKYKTTDSKEITKKQKRQLKKQSKTVKKFYKCFLCTKFDSHNYAEKQKKKRSKITSAIFFALNIVILAIVLLISFAGQDDKSQVLFPSIQWKWIGALAGVVLAQIIIEITKYFVLIKAATKKTRLYLACKVTLLGKYYDAVTPMSSGGQPFQMMYLNKRGIKGNVATSIPLVRFIFWQISYVILCSGVLIYNQFFCSTGTEIFSTIIAWVAVGLNLIIVLTVLLLSISKKVGPLIVIWVLKLGAKIKLIKNYRLTFRKVMRFVVNYQNTMKFFAKNVFVIITQFILAFLEIVAYNIIPFFIYKAFVPDGTLTIIEIFIQSIICGLTLTFIPTPGASGGAEAFFTAIFKDAFKGNLFWPILIWRIASYYLYLLLGILVLIYDFLIGNRKAERQRLKELGLKPNEPTFREALTANRQSIEIVRDQEEDKLIAGLILKNDISRDFDESTIIENGDIVSPEEMQRTMSPAEKVLTEVRIKDINKRKEKRKKKETKTQKKNSKKAKITLKKSQKLSKKKTKKEQNNHSEESES